MNKNRKYDLFSEFELNHNKNHNFENLIKKCLSFSLFSNGLTDEERCIVKQIIKNLIIEEDLYAYVDPAAYTSDEEFSSGKIKLSVNDFDKITKSLENPSSPNKKLKKSLLFLKKMKISGDKL